MKKEYIESIYAGWLAKIIGIRLGAPIEGWTYEKIKNIYGELDYYPVDYKDFAADDDSNGPIFFLRALEDKSKNRELCAQDVAEALMNYAPYEHGFFWWGGYGTATEHTAYLNLQNGIKAPLSGSIEMNGKTVAEQIGGQIFIDTWGLVTPGNPDLAAKLAKEAASVTHDGNGIYGGIFVASCISYAFEEKDVKKVIKKGLSYIPVDCEYAKVAKAVIGFYEEHKEAHDDWRKCFQYIFENFGYDKYPGNCHIIPNSAVMILALLYGEGDFERTITICNMCGWDTDCNVGNVATIMGVLCGLDGIDYHKWRKPINDFLACSSVIGSLNIMDIPYGASYIAKLAFELAGETLEEPWKSIFEKKLDGCHFQYPGSTHAMRMKVEEPKNNASKPELTLLNTCESAYFGERSLKIMAKPLTSGEKLYAYKKTYYVPEDFHDSRYNPAFSPILYPGQCIHGAAMIPEYGTAGAVCLYIKDSRSGAYHYGPKATLEKGKWTKLEYKVPAMEGALIDEMGFCFYVSQVDSQKQEFIALVDDLYADGHPDYSIGFDRENEEVWNVLHTEISQFTRLKGLAFLEDGALHLSCADYAEVYTGRHDWTDYTATFTVKPVLGDNHLVNIRVQGGRRSYAVGLMPGEKLAILKNSGGYVTLAEIDFPWDKEKEYDIKVSAKGNVIEAQVGEVRLSVEDQDSPYLRGGIGLGVRNGSHLMCKKININ